MAMVSLDRGLRVVAADDELVRLSRRSADALTGLAFTALLPDADQPRIRSRLMDLAVGRAPRVHEQVAADPRSVLAGHNLTGLRLRTDAGRDAEVVVLLTKGSQPAPPAPVPPLGTIEGKVLVGIATGESTAQIATRLFLSRAGVDYHIGRLLRQFGLPSRAALVSRAYALGLLCTGCWPPRVATDHGK